ncbi:MAG: hypothetical protein SFV17_19600 [Candidatus Obscuribacter sp.]|nr:hypothetical protein [Candidatus Obscuribacter sp.]
MRMLEVYGKKSLALSLLSFAAFNMLGPFCLAQDAFGGAASPKAEPSQVEFQGNDDYPAGYCVFPLRLVAEGEFVSVLVRDGAGSDFYLQLLTINGEPVKEKAFHEIARALTGNGPLGSTVELFGLKDSTRELVTVELTRQPYAPGLPGPAVEQELKNYFEQEDLLPLSNFKVDVITPPTEAAKRNLDLFSRSLAFNCYDRLLRLPQPKTIVCSLSLAECILANGSAGDTAGLAHCKGLFLPTIKDEAFLERFQGYNTQEAWLPLFACSNSGESLKMLQSIIPVALSSRYSEYGQKLLPGRELAAQAYTLTLANLMEDDPARAARLALEIVRLRDIETTLPASTLEKAADCLAANGQHRQALQAYNKLLHVPEGTAAVSISSAVVPYLRLLYKISGCQASLGQKEEALSSLQRALDFAVYQQSPDLQRALESGTGFFPAVSDLKLALARLYFARGEYSLAEGAALDAVARIQQALGMKSGSLKPALELLNEIYLARGDMAKAAEVKVQKDCLCLSNEPLRFSQHKQFMLLREAQSAVEKGDSTAADEIIDRLLAAHACEVGDSIQYPPPLRLFPALLRLARMLSDHGQTKASDKLLDYLDRAAVEKEHTASARVFVRAEKLFNKRGRAGSETELLALLQSMKMDKFSEARKFRWLGLTYYRAKEYDRAGFFLDLAVGCLEKMPAESRRQEEILLLLDRACLQGRLLHFSAADQSAFAALSMLHGDDLRNQPNAALSYKLALVGKVVELSEIYRAAGRLARTEDVLSSLCSQVLKGFVNGKPAYPSQDSNDAFANDFSDTFLFASLGKFYLDTKRAPLAMKQFRLARETSHSYLPPLLLLDTAVCAERLGLKEEAARNYLEFEENLGLLPYSLADRQPGLRIKYLRKAFEAVVSSPGFGKEKLPGICERLSGELQSQWPRPRELMRVYRVWLSQLPADCPERKPIEAMAGQVKTELSGKH